jgi:hypothetical protein
MPEADATVAQYLGNAEAEEEDEVETLEGPTAEDEPADDE